MYVCKEVVMRHCHLPVHKLEKVSTSLHVTQWKEKVPCMGQIRPGHICMAQFIRVNAYSPFHMTYSKQRVSSKLLATSLPLLTFYIRGLKNSHCFYTHSTNQEVVSSMFIQASIHT